MYLLIVDTRRQSSLRSREMCFSLRFVLFDWLIGPPCLRNYSNVLQRPPDEYADGGSPIGSFTSAKESDYSSLSSYEDALEDPERHPYSNYVWDGTRFTLLCRVLTDERQRTRTARMRRRGQGALLLSSPLNTSTIRGTFRSVF